MSIKRNYLHEQARKRRAFNRARKVGADPYEAIRKVKTVKPLGRAQSENSHTLRRWGTHGQVSTEELPFQLVEIDNPYDWTGPTVARALGPFIR